MAGKNELRNLAVLLIALGLVEDITGILLVVGIITSVAGVGILLLKRKKR